MKVAIITDQHFGARKSSRVFHDFFNKFYKNVFFPTLKKRGIDTVLDLGDTYDNRRTLDLWAANWSKTEYWNKLRDMGVTIHSLVGNHTAYFKDTNDINTLDGIIGEYNNINIYDKATEVEIGGLPILFIPWINQQNKEETYTLIEKSKCPVAMGHLELNGFEAHRGYIMDHGDSTAPYRHFKKVFSGHYHRKSTRGNISFDISHMGFGYILIPMFQYQRYEIHVCLYSHSNRSGMDCQDKIHYLWCFYDGSDLRILS